MKLFLYNFEIIFNSYTIFEYFNLFYFVCISIGLTIILLLLSFLFSPALGDKEKLSPYECGFEPFGDSRNLFDVQFYVVALLFIIFDLEIAFLLPWIIALPYLPALGINAMGFFLSFLAFGFWYEWKVGALEW